MADAVRFEMNGAFQDLPIHTGFTLPDLDRLFLREVVAQAMPGGSASVCHCFDEMGHSGDPFKLLDVITFRFLAK